MERTQMSGYKKSEDVEVFCMEEDCEPCDVSAKNRRISISRMLPSIVTITAFCFGLTAIRFALFYEWEMAVLCVFVSALLDALDGRLARLLKQSSHFGAELDSLSDLVCFGVTPAMLMFLKSMYSMGNVGWGVCMFFTICCGLRLARFNAGLLQNEPKPDWMKKYFSGVPAPAGAILALFPMILSFSTGSQFFLNTAFVSFCLVVSGVLMISTLKNFSSKMIEIKNGLASPELLTISLLIICLVTKLWLTLTILVSIYIFLIPYGSYRYEKTKQMELQKTTTEQMRR
ncbi:MAG: CDP-diacylglycerol--serine O-phosphatidyltransferase [Holosporaceae bacterium]|jgi:CDP-diacylglycerol--serine O-phosphatidyltransferase|nr:CDP-diacylglycerol--serine O-phosphatidyltransferase [Holosporaceae bacterium]